jgi:putative SOS response-associated peptidase YedK
LAIRYEKRDGVAYIILDNPEKANILDMALAGLWETWRSPAGREDAQVSLITTTPNELCAELHNRMPVVLKSESWPAWLGEEPADAPRLKILLGAVSGRGDDVLAGEPAGWECQK